MAIHGYIDATGIHTPTYSEILEGRKSDFRAIFGADLYLEADSQEGQMLAIFALAEHDAYQLAVSVYNAFSPHTAQGVGLSRMVKVNGIARLTASRSAVDVTLVGAPGTIITGGAVRDVADRKWDLPATVALPVNGEITVTATSQEPGEVRAAAGDVSNIATPTRGWVSVTNAAPATAGAAVESDATLRKRQVVSTALPSQTILEGIAGAVANLPGVTRFKPYENDTAEADANGLPPHSVCMVVEGGEAGAIAQAIAIKKVPGSPTFGDAAVTVLDRYGMPNVIRFARPRAVPPLVTVRIRPLSGYVSTTGGEIKAKVAGHLDGYKIGEEVLLSKLYTPINAAEPTEGVKTFDVVGLLLARPGEVPQAQNLVLDFDEVAVGDTLAITVEIVA